jgi:hypothetical protein
MDDRVSDTERERISRGISRGISLRERGGSMSSSVARYKRRRYLVHRGDRESDSGDVRKNTRPTWHRPDIYLLVVPAWMEYC